MSEAPPWKALAGQMASFFFHLPNLAYSYVNRLEADQPRVLGNAVCTLSTHPPGKDPPGLLPRVSGAQSDSVEPSALCSQGALEDVQSPDGPARVMGSRGGRLARMGRSGWVERRLEEQDILG